MAASDFLTDSTETAWQCGYDAAQAEADTGRIWSQLTAVHDVVDGWLATVRAVAPAACPTVRLTTAAGELLVALGADRAEIDRLAGRARAVEAADSRPRAGGEIAGRDEEITRLGRELAGALAVLRRIELDEPATDAERAAVARLGSLAAGQLTDQQIIAAAARHTIGGNRD